MSEFSNMTVNRRQSSKQEATAGYFRKPLVGKEPGWIAVCQYRGGANLEHFLDREFQPLRKYGDVTQFLDEDCKVPDPGGIWGPILRHPDGPAEFPAEQVVTARWYKSEVCPVPVDWKQLAGVKITQYQCPQCNREPFVSAMRDGKPLAIGDGVVGLAKELQNAHSWDRLSVMAYGEKVGIDFNSVGTPTDVIEYVYEEKAQTEPETQVDIEDAISQAPLAAEDSQVAMEPLKCACGWEVREDSKNPTSSMSTHKNVHCPLRETVSA